MEEEIRAVVLGWQKSDKVSVINSILGAGVESDGYLVRSVKSDGEVNGSRICLINTPCWWENYCLGDSPEIIKQELVCSVFLCPPGPHVFLLVINLSFTFTEENRLSIEKHLSLFGERIWRHTIVIFTRVDSLKDKPIEQHIQSQGDLQQIIQRCGGRFHGFERQNTGVQELIHKIHGVVAENNGRHFDTNEEELLEMKRKRRDNEERAKNRQEKLKEKRELLKEATYVRRLEEVRVVLLGWVFAGKSSAGNTILNRDEFGKEGRTIEGTRGFGDVEGRRMTVLDTPGWWKYFSSQLNPDFIRSAILESVSECKKFPHAILLVIPGDTSFQEEQKKVIEENMSILGEDVWRHTIVLFTWGDRFPDVSIEEHIESEGAALQWLVEKCRNRYHVFENINKKNRDQVSQLLQKIDEMVAQNSLFCLKREENCDERCDKQEDEIVKFRLKDVSLVLNEVFNRKAKEIQYKTEKLCADVLEECSHLDESDSFKLCPPKFQDQPPEHHKVNIPPQQDNVSEQIKTLLEREFSRMESIIIDGVLESLQDIKSSIKIDQAEKRQMSRDAVERWINNCKLYVQETIDKIQDPESENRTTRLKMC